MTLCVCVTLHTVQTVTSANKIPAGFISRQKRSLDSVSFSGGEGENPAMEDGGGQGGQTTLKMELVT